MRLLVAALLFGSSFSVNAVVLGRGPYGWDPTSPAITFEGQSVGAIPTLLNASFVNSESFAAAIQSSNPTIGLGSRVATNLQKSGGGFTDIAIKFDRPQSEVGAYVHCIAGNCDTPGEVQLVDGDGSVFFSFTVYHARNVYWRGLGNFGEPPRINELRFTTTGAQIAIDTLRYQDHRYVVPEPATWALSAFGLAILVIGHRGKRWLGSRFRHAHT